MGIDMCMFPVKSKSIGPIKVTLLINGFGLLVQLKIFDEPNFHLYKVDPSENTDFVFNTFVEIAEEVANMPFSDLPKHINCTLSQSILDMNIHPNIKEHYSSAFSLIKRKIVLKRLQNG